MKTLLVLWFSAWFSSVTVTQYVDDMEALLRANRDAYLAGPHTPESRDVAIAYFDRQWASLKTSQACGNRLLGASGDRCLADRSRNGRWPWETYYRDPILNAPLR